MLNQIVKYYALDKNIESISSVENTVTDSRQGIFGKTQSDLLRQLEIVPKAYN